MKLLANDISVVRGEDLIFAGISFDVSNGEALVVRGENGAGKSTLLRSIAGLLPLESGAISLDHLETEFGEAKLPELCHYLGSENAMKPAMSVGENLAFWQDFAGQPHHDPEEALDLVGLEGLSDLPFGHLSTGQRRRTSIARLLVSYRPIWLLDEPTSGLDAHSARQFTGLMEAHLADDGIIIAATHIPLGLKKAKEFELIGMAS